MDKQFPLSLRVAQIMTGFGAGCGVGVGLGYPIALGTIPVVGDMVRPITSSGSQAFGGVAYKAMGMLKKLGIKNLRAGVGCGVGFGYGFGVGLALKPGAVQQLTDNFQAVFKGLSSRIQKQMSPAAPENELGLQNALSPVTSQVPVNESVGLLPPMQTGLALKQTAPPSEVRQTEEELREENQILRTLLRHQELIQDLKEENAALRLLLDERSAGFGFEEGSKFLTRKDQSPVKNPCEHCFDCRRRSRRRQS